MHDLGCVALGSCILILEMIGTGVGTCILLFLAKRLGLVPGKRVGVKSLHKRAMGRGQRVSEGFGVYYGCSEHVYNWHVKNYLELSFSGSLFRIDFLWVGEMTSIQAMLL